MSGLPGEAQARFARQALAGALEQGGPVGLGPEAAQAMREALRDVCALALCWRAGTSDVGPAAAAEVMDAIRGDLPHLRAQAAAVTSLSQHPGQAADGAGPDPDVIRGIERVTGEVYHHTRDEWWAGSDPEQPGEAEVMDAPWRSGGEVPGG